MSSPALKATWSQIRESIAQNVGQQRFDHWLGNAHLIGLTDDRIELGVPTLFHAGWIEEKFKDAILDAVEEATGHRPTLKLSISGYLFRKVREQQQAVRNQLRKDGDGTDVEVEPGVPAAPANGAGGSGDVHGNNGAHHRRATGATGKADAGHGANGSAATLTPTPRGTAGRASARDKTAPAAASSEARPSRGGSTRRGRARSSSQSGQVFNLKERYRLDTFVVGKCNKLAYSCAGRLVEKPMGRPNPLFIQGGPGMGKTHLMQGTARALLEQHPNLRVLYVSCDYFVNRFVNALRGNKTEDFRKEFRNVNVLLLDDVHLLSSKQASQEEFLHTFDALDNMDAQIALSSDETPTDIKKLSDHLKSRFEAGLVVRVTKPDYDTRLAVITQRTEAIRQHLPIDVCEYMAERDVENFRELEGDLNKLSAMVALLNERVTVDIAREVLDDLKSYNARMLDLTEIENVVIARLGVSSEQIHSQARKREIAYARQICMYLARHHTDYSLNEIGKFFGGKNHATVVFSEKKIAQMMADDGNVRDDVDTITRGLRADTTRPSRPRR